MTMKRAMTTTASDALSRLDAEGVWVVGGAIRDALAGDGLAGDFDVDLAVRDG